jgi:hypothetical protein
MPSFRARFQAMVEELRAHPQVEVYEVEIRPSATNSALRKAEAEIGMPLPADLLEFYRAHDGVFLEWGLRGGEYRYKTEPFQYPDDDQPPGCINLLPVIHAMSTGWEADSHVNEIQDDHWIHLYGRVPDPRPRCGAVCVDNFRRYNHGDLILGPEPVMVVSTDYGADMDSSDYASFSTYLDLTLAIYGTNRYDNGLGIGWTRHSQRVDAWTQRPTLDSLIAGLLAET